MSKPGSREAHFYDLLGSLTPDELQMLRAHPYEKSGPVHGTREVKIAQRLITQGLLEARDTDTPLIVRCTSQGEELRKPLTPTSAERCADEVRGLATCDPEAADALRTRLWQRVLAEVAISPESPSLQKLARAALRTLNR